MKVFHGTNIIIEQNPATGLWHLSTKTLSQIFLAEVKDQIIEYPEEQS